ncbi:hypothetical protein KL918_004672 [Ogataea parapolymorpha]|uniref:Membrane protein n=1 Tax=Ogataea parapolymorpha (strain ATCC 26012 / BCRC 20466 / JCM 22074 / NRRL Y-7560 / DL-1) TaxID=871575 RepID=W1QLD1_OGAPD|nr:putative membrane protein [Ogataea parapolymorpha DL-1]ESX03626.1 putative membrane protein [Ogataea parapolymorpha DL-1]KAG7865430.1 hypothetical protein KL918_004672 [Ogataea parapolymorpha]KAG7873875.1 hypothetical protein KL916_002035 [Ogataea parapolymorpha]
MTTVPRDTPDQTDETDFVEFRLAGDSVTVVEHGPVPIEPETDSGDALETPAHKDEGSFHSTSDDEEWKEMDIQVNHDDIYNIRGEKIDTFVQSAETIDNKAESSQGYTRISAQEEAAKYLEMNEKFDFLFQNENSNLRKLRNGDGGSDEAIDETADETIDETIDPSATQLEEQLYSTRSMLTEPQKVAYAALVKLIIFRLHLDLSLLRGSGSSSIYKKIAVAQKSFTRWSMGVMAQLYEHLGIKEGAEREMIEKLSCHGIEASDLVGWLNTNLTLDNKLRPETVQTIGVDASESTLDIDIRWTLICDLFLILLESSTYDARSRTLLLQFATSIGLEQLAVFQFERRITDALEMEASMARLNNSQVWDEKDILAEHKRKYRKQKLVKIGFATVAGGLVIGLSAGMLAPVIGAGLAAGLTTVGIGGTSGFLAGTAGTTIITSTGVLTGMRIGNKGMGRRVGAVNTFEFKPLHNTGRVNLVLTVSGWMSGKLDDVRLPFSTIDPVMGDLYSLLWEPEMLTSMGQTINILASEVLTQSIQQILGSTILITLMAAVQLPMMLSKLGYLLDNPWNVSLDRAWSAGLVLADTLRRGKLGFRPITLVGFSLGARVIYSCLLDLAKRGDYGLVENVYLFGSPFVVKQDQVAMARSVVSGRFVNGYSKKDWILGYLFRATSGGLSRVAGLSPVDEVENFNCSELVQGHMEYRKVMPKLMKEMGWEVLNEEFVEIDQPDEEETKRQRKLVHDFEQAAKNHEGGKSKKWYDKLFRKNNKQWWEMYEEGVKEEEQKQELFDVDELAKQVEEIAKEAHTEPASSSSQLKQFNLKTPPSGQSFDSGDRKTVSPFNMKVVKPESETETAEYRPFKLNERRKPSRSENAKLNLNAVETEKRKKEDSTNIYDDEDEFPTDERNLEITFI